MKQYNITITGIVSDEMLTDREKDLIITYLEDEMCVDTLEITQDEVTK